MLHPPVQAIHHSPSGPLVSDFADSQKKSDPPPDFYGEDVDRNVFEQILQMDEDDNDFSKQIVIDFLEQVRNTFEKMEQEM